VTWEAVHFGIRQRLTTRITRLERPHLFVDEMVSGAFRSFTHLHQFERENDGTRMIDVFTYVSPLGAIGRLADRLFLAEYMRRFLSERAATIKRVAEGTA
jgi:ligand-binding SRPBCC domain-containing protein